MDRYYNILGIPLNSSKEEIKNAYYTKIKALHPDKIHGTPLEDTATFFTTEINEAYNMLMAQFENNSSSNFNNHDQAEYLEEEIYVEKYGYLKYTLSNDINVIVNVIYNRFGFSYSDNTSQIIWEINPNLSLNVKKIMNRHDLDYSMTSYLEGSKEIVVINKKSGNNWYITVFKIFTESDNNTANQNNESSTQKTPFWVFAKIAITVLIFGIIFQQCNNHLYTQNFETVTSCTWLNVRRTPSSTNNSNIIEAIRVNTIVEVLERTNTGWVRIRYNNGKTGYVHSNYLSR
jgi:uncharacterized protein YgiM (DUF1202 family)